MDRYDWAALNYLESASDADWMCFAWFYLDHYHVRLALWMVNQRQCPEAVALALSWYSYPDGCFKYRRQGNVSYYHFERFAVFETVELRYATGFYKTSDIGFDPANDIADPVGPMGFGRNWLDSLSESDALENKRLAIAIPGQIIEPKKVAADWIEGLPAHLSPLFSYNHN